MENVAFYREWLPLNKKEFRILAMLADFGGEYHGNLTDMCRYFSVSPQHKNREALREAIQHLTDRHYIESSVNGRTYSLRIIPKEKEIALPREWLERVRTREYSSESGCHPRHAQGRNASPRRGRADRRRLYPSLYERCFQSF